MSVQCVTHLTGLSQSSRHLVLSGVDVTGGPATLSAQSDQRLDQDLRHKDRGRAED